MPQYMMVYKGEATDVSEMSEQDQQKVMAAWGAWMEKVGANLSDVGAPFGPSASLVDDGTDGSAVTLSGYTIVEAADMAGAKALADGHPYLSDGKGDFAIDIYELMPVPM